MNRSFFSAFAISLLLAACTPTAPAYAGVCYSHAHFQEGMAHVNPQTWRITRPLDEIDAQSAYESIAAEYPADVHATPGSRLVSFYVVESRAIGASKSRLVPVYRTPAGDEEVCSFLVIERAWLQEVLKVTDRRGRS